MPYIMLLADGETYTNLDGCKILWVPDSDDDVEQFDMEYDTIENPQGWIEFLESEIIDPDLPNALVIENNNMRVTWIIRDFDLTHFPSGGR